MPDQTTSDSIVDDTVPESNKQESQMQTVPSNSASRLTLPKKLEYQADRDVPARTYAPSGPHPARPGFWVYEAPGREMLAAIPASIQHVTQHGFALADAIGNKFLKDIHIEPTALLRARVAGGPKEGSDKLERGDIVLIWDLEEGVNADPLARGAVLMRKRPDQGGDGKDGAHGPNGVNGPKPALPEVSTAKRRHGKIKDFHSRGFGFIESASLPKDAHVTHHDVAKAKEEGIDVGDEVTFDVIETLHKGQLSYRATNIKAIRAAVASRW